MKFTAILLGLAIAGATFPAAANEINEFMARPDTPSILYVGYDKVNAEGQPVCTECQAEAAQQEARRKERMARHEMPEVMRPEGSTSAPPAPAVASAPDVVEQQKVQQKTTVTTTSAIPNAANAGSGIMRGSLR